jgi:hypothetical protein
MDKNSVRYREQIWPDIVISFEGRVQRDEEKAQQLVVEEAPRTDGMARSRIEIADGNVISY